MLKKLPIIPSSTSQKFTHYSHFILISLPIIPILFLNINGPCSPLMAYGPWPTHMAAWPTSENTAKQKSFQNKLQNFQLHHGDTSPPNLTTYSFQTEN